MPPKPKPSEVDLSPSSSPQEDNTIAPSSVALKRLEEISGRRTPAGRTKSELLPRTSPANEASSGDAKASDNVQAALLRTHSQPVPAAAHPVTEIDSIPSTPTTRRRQMLATELPEDLRLSKLSIDAADFAT